MDRLRRILAGGTLAMMMGTVVGASGCRSTRNEVPPAPRLPMTGEPSSVGFNSSPHPYNALSSPYATNPSIAGAGQPGMPGSPGMGSGMPGSGMDAMPPGMGAGASPSGLGTPLPGSSGMGQPTPNAYGPPGTSGGIGR